MEAELTGAVKECSVAGWGAALPDQHRACVVLRVVLVPPPWGMGSAEHLWGWDLLSILWCKAGAVGLLPARV